MAQPHDTERSDHDEPRHHDRTEQTADAVGAVPLNREHANQNHDGDRHHIRIEQRCRDLQSLDRAEHGDRRRDDAVAVEQRRAKDPSMISTGMRALFSRRCGSRPSGENPAFALVVGAHHDRDVFDRDDQQQRVDDERQHAEDVRVRRGHRMRAEEALAHRIQRTGADVAIDDADSGQREWKDRAWSRGSAGQVPPIRRRG